MLRKKAKKLSKEVTRELEFLDKLSAFRKPLHDSEIRLARESLEQIFLLTDETDATTRRSAQAKVDSLLRN